MNIRPVIAAFLCAFGALVSALPAYAADVSDLPPLTPKGQYFVLTPYDSSTTSKCIGNPVTPLCAVETILACYTREIADLCRPAYPEWHPLPPFRPSEFRDHNTVYRVVRREILDDRYFPWKARRKEQLRAGDIRIDIAINSCSYQQLIAGCAPMSRDRIVYVVRKQDDHWVVTTFGDLDYLRSRDR